MKDEAGLKPAFFFRSRSSKGGTMFTPRTISVGDHVRINSDLSNADGTFGAGHEFEIIDIHFHGDDAFYDLRDHDLNLLGRVPFGDISVVTDRTEE
jgi:hypothetical protein